MAEELQDFSDCVLGDRQPEPSGVEGLTDIRALQAILRSHGTGKAVAIRPVRQGTRRSRRAVKHFPRFGSSRCGPKDSGGAEGRQGWVGGIEPAA